jgi:uncharacterized protein (DUF433 family)
MLSAKDNLVMAFSEEHAERLTGLSKHQLRHWDNTSFFKPSLADENRRVAYSRVYSFKDIVALRVLNVLRNQFGISLQHLRKVSDKLSHLEDDRWTKTTLYVFKRKVVFVEPETEQPREVVSGQFVLGLALRAVVEDTERAVAQFRERPSDKIGKIERNRLVAHNATVIAGTRIATATIKRFHAAGYSVEKIIAEYPDLTAQDIKAALEYPEKVKAKAA